MDSKNIINVQESWGGREERNSTIELLRFLCITGIISMHAFGGYNGTRGDLIQGIIINTLFNNAVSLFILISGFYGIKSSVKKIFKLEMMIIIYSVLSYLVTSHIGEGFSVKELVRAFLPVFSRKYWFMSAYMIILLFGNYINAIVDFTRQEIFEKLLLLMFIVFSVIPTITFVSITEEGIFNMLFMYLVGRWIRKYFIKRKSDKFYVGLLVMLLIIAFGINYITASVVNRGELFYIPFAKNSSLFIVFTSIIIFIIISQERFKFSNKIINRMAGNVLAAYLFEYAVRCVLSKYIDIYVYKGTWYYIFILILYALVVAAICVLIEMIRNATMGNLESAIGSYIEKIYYVNKEKIYRFMYGRNNSQ